MKFIRIAILAAISVLPLVAQAHAHLKQTVPADGSIVKVAPDSFSLSFSESAHLTALSVQKQGDAQSQKITPLPTNASQEFRIPAPKLGPGTYTLSYRVVAADDNHLTSGTITFSIAAGAP